MVGVIGNAPIVSCFQNRQITFFLHPDISILFIYYFRK
jgi:hypothetical protein